MTFRTSIRVLAIAAISFLAVSAQARDEPGASKPTVIPLLARDVPEAAGKEITVRTFLGQRARGDRGVCIEVGDDGRGISAAHIDHIFDPFFTTAHSNGAGDIRGLGLTIAHQIVREHQGDLTVESREGLGSTFCLFLPVGVRTV